LLLLNSVVLYTSHERCMDVEPGQCEQCSSDVTKRLTHKLLVVHVCNNLLLIIRYLLEFVNNSGNKYCVNICGKINIPNYAQLAV